MDAEGLLEEQSSGDTAVLLAVVPLRTKAAATLQPLMWALARGVGACAVTFTGLRSCSARQTSDGGECRHGSTDAKTGGQSRRACMHELNLRLNKWHRPVVNHFKSSWTKNAVTKLLDLDDTLTKVNDKKIQF